VVVTETQGEKTLYCEFIVSIEGYFGDIFVSPGGMVEMAGKERWKRETET